MDIKLSHSLLKEFLDTKLTPETIADDLSLCGPTIDRMNKTKDDTIYDIEIITNRVDSASAFGVAREAAAIMPEFGHKAKLINNPYDHKLEDLGDLPGNYPVSVQILDSSLVPRFSAISLSGVTIKDSPKQVQNWLNGSGQRPLNNVIDISNELTLKYGQPVHIFDLDKIAGNKMIFRESRKGESILTLDGRKHALRGGDIVIEDGSGNLIDLCGVMGGGLSHVDENTKNILLFVQTYEPKHIRRTSLYTQERTLAAQLFEKSPDLELVLPVLIEGVKLLESRAGAAISSGLIDLYLDPPRPRPLDLDLNWLKAFIGIDISAKKATTILNRLGFETSTKGSTLKVTIPTWRLNDISIPEDLAEEITRVYGYFRLPSILPTTTLPDTHTDPLLDHEYNARKYLSSLGFTEIYNIALVSKDIFDRSTLKLDKKLKLRNPLSNDYEYMRTSLIPSLLANLHDNRGKIDLPIRIFELANTYHATTKTLPSEISTLTFLTYGQDFLTTKGYIEALGQHLHLNLRFTLLTKPKKPFTTEQAASIYSGKNLIGTIGPINPIVANNFSLDKSIIAVDLDFTLISKNITYTHNFAPVPQYASIYDDITISSDKPIGELLEALKKADPIIIKTTYITTHENKHTFRLELNDPKGNLIQETATKIKQKILKKFT